MKTMFFSIAVLFGVFSSAHAHHGFGYDFDGEKVVTFSGTVKEFKFINPHARLLVDVTGEGGQIEVWDCEFRGANGLARTGWRENTFQPGQAIEITGYGARRNPTECYFESATLGDGTYIHHDEPLGGDPFTEGATLVASATVVGNDVPNFAGVWQRGGGAPPGMGAAGMAPGMGMGPQPGGPNRFAWVLNEAGQAALDAYDPLVDDPSRHCNPVSLARLWGTGNPTEITQTDDVVTIHHEWMDAMRTVYLMPEHPEGLEDRVLGHSTGWFEDSTLVIDTIAYPEGIFWQLPGLPNSNQLHTVERLTLSEDGKSFGIEWTADDGLYFHDQLTGRSGPMTRRNTTLRPYNCVHPDVGVASEE